MVLSTGGAIDLFLVEQIIPKIMAILLSRTLTGFTYNCNYSLAPSVGCK